MSKTKHSETETIEILRRQLVSMTKAARQCASVIADIAEEQATQNNALSNVLSEQVETLMEARSGIREFGGDLNEYQELAGRTDLKDRGRIEGITYYALALVDEVGEICGPLKKYMSQGHQLPKDEHLLEEYGDTLWNIARAVAHLGYDLSDVARLNIEKLKIRYPDGFSAKNSQEREVQNAQIKAMFERFVDQNSDE